MEVCVPGITSACLDISSSSGSSADPCNLIQYSSRDLSVNELKTCLTEILNIEDIGISTSGVNLSPGKDDIGNVVEECECQVSDKSTSGNSASEKQFSKCATFPPCDGPKISGDVVFGEKGKNKEDITAEVSEVNGSGKASNQCNSRSISLPTPLKLVSAMKGSREKQGTPPKKLSVTWAPDVYDPIPTSVSHVPQQNQRNRRNGKKSGKYKQKGGGKSSQGSRGKDKKQTRKNGGGSNRLKPFREDIGVIGCGEPQISAGDFIVGSPDPFCGSSFLKKSVSKLHFPVAEAT